MITMAPTNKFITYSHRNTFLNILYIKSSALNERNGESKINIQIVLSFIHIKYINQIYEKLENDKSSSNQWYNFKLITVDI